jgi:UDP:flavonoid glycosyltransferase YjiC (YdhE family)
LIKVLFLSLEKQHDELFQRIEQSLRRVTAESIICKIVDTSNMTNIPPFYRLDREKVGFAYRILRAFKPDVVVVANDHGVNATFIAFCKLMGIQTLAVQDGILSNFSIAKPLEKVLMKNKAFLWRLVCLVIYSRLFLKISIKIGWPARRVCWGTTPIDRIAVMGKYYKKVFIDRGVHLNKITVTGYPLLDGVTNSAPCLCKNDLSKRIGLDRNKPLALLITQPFVEDGFWTPSLREFFIKSVVDNLVSRDFQVVIKLHPRESQYVNDNGHHGVFVTRNMPLEELIPASDVVVTVSSTVGLWALAYGKPLLVMKCFPSVKKNVLGNLGITINEIYELPKALDAITKNAESKAILQNKTQKILFDHAYRLDGKASERIARLILTMNTCYAQQRTLKD